MARRSYFPGYVTVQPFASPVIWEGSGKAAYGGQPDQFATWGGGQGSWGYIGLPGAVGFGGSAGPSTQ
jgi:hypothetical protein